jgi:hypothetical protein
MLQLARDGGERPDARRGNLMKIYVLMALIGVIAALAHLNRDRPAPEQEA